MRCPLPHVCCRVCNVGDADAPTRPLRDSCRERVRPLRTCYIISSARDLFKLAVRVQDQAVKMGSSKSLTRASGAALLHIGATHISTALTGDAVRSKQQLRVRRSAAT